MDSGSDVEILLASLSFMQAALLHLVDHLCSRGLDWLDVQVMTPHLARLGATPIPRPTFRQGP